MTTADYAISKDLEERKTLRLSAGNTVRVHQKIVEGDKKRSQVFEGVVIARKHGTEPGATFTVRRVGSDGIAVEKIFPLYSPTIEKIEVSRETKTRRSKIYFLRDKTPRQVREKLRRVLSLGIGTEPSVEEKPEEKESTATEESEAQEETA
ncbi:MAG: 50S ribosomal protein L19 [Candidatus Kaiserbacteria bacterium]|nr:50S ribosomal protein L19 [Candidatus Kaiserbacteria bacterium]